MADVNISDEDLLTNLRDLARSLDRSPRVEDIREHGQYDYDTYRRRFGGISEALEAAGIEETHNRINCGPGNVATEELIDDLRRLGDDLGRPPKTTDVMQGGEYSIATYYKHFETFADALEAAGYPAAPGNFIPRELLLEALRELASDVGSQPSGAEMNEHGKYTASTYRRRFGSWEAALEAASLDETTE